MDHFDDSVSALHSHGDGRSRQQQAVSVCFHYSGSTRYAPYCWQWQGQCLGWGDGRNGMSTRFASIAYEGRVKGHVMDIGKAAHHRRTGAVVTTLDNDAVVAIFHGHKRAWWIHPQFPDELLHQFADDTNAPLHEDFAHRLVCMRAATVGAWQDHRRIVVSQRHQRGQSVDLVITATVGITATVAAFMMAKHDREPHRIAYADGTQHFKTLFRMSTHRAYLD